MSEEPTKEDRINKLLQRGHDMMDLARSYYARAEQYKHKAANNFNVAEATVRIANRHFEDARKLEESNGSN